MTEQIPEQAIVGNDTTEIDLIKIKNKIESMSKEHHIEVLKLIRNNSEIVINENKNGVFINLSYLEPQVMETVQKYIDYINDQDNVLNPVEDLKSNYMNKLNNQSDKDDNDNDFITVYR
jgi:hypothetical protein